LWFKARLDQANSSWGSYLEKPCTKKGLVEWLKVKALSSSPSTAKKKKKKKEWGRGEAGEGLDSLKLQFSVIIRIPS
jgi:hypothetical protein